MNITRPLNIRVVGLSLGSFLSITFILCVVYDLIFPEAKMYQSWIRLLPGFEWLTLKSFFLGIVESFFYGVYIALVFVPLYNLFNGLIGQNE